MSETVLSIVLQARDEASSALESLGEKAEGLGSRIKTAMGLGEKGFTDLAKGMAGAATAGVGFYNMLDTMEASQLRVAKASDRFQDAQLAVEKAQKALNEAVEKYGVGSEQANMKAADLEGTQRNLAIATENVKNAQQDQIKGMTTMVSSTIPMMVLGMATLYTSMGPVGLAIATLTFAIQIFAKAWAENWGGIREVTTGVIDAVMGAINTFVGWIQGIVDALRGVFDWFLRLLGLSGEARGASTGTEAGEEAAGYTYMGEEGGEGLPGAQFGGRVLRTGLALIHAGETVVPGGEKAALGSVTVGPINVYASPGMDEDALARKASQYIVEELRRTYR